MKPEVRGASTASPRTDWLLTIVLCIITTILVLQKTKQALLPAKQTPILWAAELVTIAGVLILRSGWGRDNRWAAEQARLGTLANNFYEPRRSALIDGGAIGLGVFCALWWGLATWGVLFTGMRRGVPARGLLDFIVAGIAGAITGGVAGAVLGLIIGHWWETSHRRRRAARQTTHA
jgi:hypothetical protein